MKTKKNVLSPNRKYADISKI